MGILKVVFGLITVVFPLISSPAHAIPARGDPWLAPVGGPESRTLPTSAVENQWWATWREDISSAGWDWPEFKFEMINDNGAILRDDMATRPVDNLAWFVFEPAPATSDRRMWKEVLCTNLCDPLATATMVKLLDYPVIAEPGILALIGISLIVFGLYQRRSPR